MQRKYGYYSSFFNALLSLIMDCLTWLQLQNYERTIQGAAVGKLVDFHLSKMGSVSTEAYTPDLLYEEHCILMDGQGQVLSSCLLVWSFARIGENIVGLEPLGMMNRNDRLR